MPARIAITSCGMRRTAAITRPHVSSAVAYDGRPGIWLEETITPRRVHAGMSMCGTTPTWLTIFSRSRRSSSGARIGVRSRISASTSVSLSRPASVSTSLVWSFQIVTSWPATFLKQSSVRMVSW